MKRKCKQCHFPESKLAGPHLPYIRKLRRSRASVPEHTQTRSFNLRHGTALGAASPSTASQQHVLPAASQMSCQTAHSVPIRWLQVKESPKFCSKVCSYFAQVCLQIVSSIAHHQIKGYCCLSCWGWILKDSAAAVHPTNPINPSCSIPDAPLLTAPKAHN